MPGRTKALNQQQAEDRAMLLFFEADMARQWVLELRKRALMVSAAATSNEQPVLSAKMLAAMEDLSSAHEILQRFEDRLTAYEPKKSGAERTRKRSAKARARAEAA